MALSARHDAASTRVAVPAVGLAHLVLLGGAGLVLYALWQPFYLVKLPVAAFARIGETFTDPTLRLYASAAARNAARINAEGGVRVSAWDAFERIDVAVAALCALAVVVVALRAAGHVSRDVARHAWVLGAAAAGLVGARMLKSPVPEPMADYVRLGRGSLMLLAGALAVAVGAWLSAARPAR